MLFEKTMPPDMMSILRSNVLRNIFNKVQEIGILANKLAKYVRMYIRINGLDFTSKKVCFRGGSNSALPIIQTLDESLRRRLRRPSVAEQIDIIDNRQRR